MVRQEDILKPLIFLDIFDYPPTAMEIWRFLGAKAEFEDVIKELDKYFFCHPERSVSGVKDLKSEEVLKSSETIDPSRGAQDDKEKKEFHYLQDLQDPSQAPLLKGRSFDGFYFLPGREELIKKRREFFHLAERKFKIAKRAAWLLRFIPSVKMIAVCNNFYYRPESDIDFFIITAPGRLWLTRFFATVLLDIFHLRARGKKTSDKICLSFYLSEDNLNLENIRLAKNNSSSLEGSDPSASPQDDKKDDPYLAYWLAFLEPIYGQKCYNEFWQANAWLKKVFPNLSPKVPVARRRIAGAAAESAARDSAGAKITYVAEKTPPSLPFARGGDFGAWLEKIAKDIQWRRLSPRVKEMAALNDTRAVINDKMLKFHENDRREFYREELRKKKEEIFNNF